ncbi:MAG: phosphoribosylformimino-5-aminoimidazole carboxamide ribotide isomerase [Clostridiales bacterium]|nr:phosphoribosylformimino-5-aminoimidazole carboxamide ribotide isomerase [Clostridiales bacterium]
MRFRPCIDIHNGKVKQIVGGSLKDEGNQAVENYKASEDADYFASLYRRDSLQGGHIILLNAAGSEYYEADLLQAQKALRAYEGGLQIGGGITADNAKRFLDMGASHVIVTSYVFRDGMIDYERLKQLNRVIGKEHLVLDLSCRKRDGEYYIVTNRWQTFTGERITEDILEGLSQYCDEYLVHAVDVEGKAAGIDRTLLSILGDWNKIPVTYAGGVSDYADLEVINQIGKSNIDVTIGSAIDLFGGALSYKKVVDICRKLNEK